jgi:hypothetical protein
MLQAKYYLTHEISIVIYKSDDSLEKEGYTKKEDEKEK